MNKMELRDVIIEYLKDSKKKLGIVELLNILLIKNLISDKDKCTLEMKLLREICSDLVEEGLLIEKPLGRFVYNNDYKEEIIKERKKAKKDLREVVIEYLKESNYQFRKLKFSSISSTIFILIIFIAITISEYIFAYRDVTYGIVLSLFITLSIYIVISVALMREDYMRSAESLALIPLYVLFTSSLPWFFINQQYLIPAVYSIILALCFWHINEHQLDFHELGFTKDKALKYAFMGLFLAIPSGFIEYIILAPNPTYPIFDVRYLLRDTIYMVFFVGLAEELLFRGLIFNDLKRIFGWKSALLGQGALFGMMHMTWRSPIEIAFTFAAGMVLGYIYHRTKSLVGPISMHAVNNILLISILPYLYPSIAGWFL